MITINVYATENELDTTELTRLSIKILEKADKYIKNKIKKERITIVVTNDEVIV